MADVVISYGREQEPMAATVARALEADGYSVWWDHDIPAHRAYASLIEEKFQAAKAVIVIWSPAAAQSEWVRAEADLARSQQKLIQVSVQETIPPLPFSQIQFAPLQAWDGSPDHPEWRRVRASLRTLCGDGAEQPPQPVRPPQPQPQPAPPKPPAPAQRQPMLLIAVVGLLAAAVVGLVFTRQPAPTPASAPAPAAPVAGPAPAPAAATAPAPTPTTAPAPPTPASAPVPEARLGDFILPQSSVQPLSPADIAGLDKAELRLARNEIYARHGRIFRSPDLAAHFSRYAWYRPVAAEVALSPVEQRNVDLLQQAEAGR